MAGRGACGLTADPRFLTQSDRARTQEALTAILAPEFAKRSAADWREVRAGATVVSYGYALRATAARDRERRLAYEANLAAAHSALRLYDAAEARRLLELAPESLRGLEWSWLASQLDTSLVGAQSPVTGFVKFSSKTTPLS